MTQFYPINLRIENQNCLIVGGGKVAERKVLSLLDCGAIVRVISQQVTEVMDSMAGEGRLELLLRSYEAGDADGFFLVICATDDENINQQVAQECQERNILVNVVDDPIKCNFFVPSVLQRGSLSISISTEGKSPLLARKIRESLEGQFGVEYVEYLELLGEFRTRVINQVPDIKTRKKIFTQVVESDVLDLLRQGNQEKAKERIEDVFINFRS
ncbi:MAG: bifunctional precorrin-2 dehydrogenase/sirohydrochlorin ferrochelatase [Clostridia bacterium]|nr:bifunctional precorrin-2 dehydrogenase/sirohydrochlorin ferrochelatase [Clostridia bacterium]